MSELINNVSLKRKEKLKEIILSLHEGVSFEDAKKEFAKHFKDVTTQEIAAIEQELVRDDLVTINEIQSLCDVHAAVFEGSISDIHSLSDFENVIGHPVKIFKEENERIEILIKEEIEPYLEQTGKTAHLMLRVGYDRLWEIDKHYSRKENLLFPKLERVGITTPPQVMWGVDDEIRDEIKDIIQTLSTVDFDEEILKDKIKKNLFKVRDMIFKEDNILMPMIIEHMTHFDWILVDASSDEIGWFLEEPKQRWIPKEEKEEEEVVTKAIAGEIPFDAGSLSPEEANAIFNTVPLDMTFVDKDGNVKYFTQGKERIFHRPKTVIGRHVSMCHPPQSVHIVDSIIESFRSGEKDKEDFWIQMKDMFVHISYYAVRDKDGSYLGVLEVSQDIKPLRDLTGEKRILDE